MSQRITSQQRIAAILLRKDAAAFYTRTPLQFLIALLGIVFISETLVMFLLPVLFPKGANEALVALADAGLLTLMISPAVWLLQVRPLRADAHRLADLNRELSAEVGARVELEQRLTRQAFHDPLTGLPNRAFFLQELERTLARQQRQPRRRSTVLFIDLNRFKSVNDRLGHGAGDQVLVEVARRLERTVRPGDIVARLGGDEFTVLLDNLEQAGHAAKVAERILEQLRQPFSVQEPQAGDDVQHHTVHVSASIGFAGGEVTYERAEALLHDADMAMYRAKARGTGQFEISAPAAARGSC
ncbi:MAG: GGDEF domain-containing protein [Terriglobales bacterium]